jgi:large repetitive protein
VSMLANGDIQFIPNANYHGAASFTYTVSDGNGATTDASVSITVNAVNDTPVVQGESTDTNEDTTLYIAASTLLANDSDVDTITDGQVLSLSAVNSISGQTHGTVSLVNNADGTQTVQFTPDANYHGAASFNYTVSNGNGGYATAVATINIAAVNDAPVTAGEISSTDEDTAIFFTQAKLLDNDSDVDTATDGQVLTITAVSGTSNGTVSTLANGDIRFIPNANYHGAASFTYTVSDGNGGTTDASVNLTVLAVNDTPVVQGESTNTNEDTTLYIAASALLTNDSDVDTITDGQVLSLSAVNSISGQTHGTVSLVTNADGTQTVQFTPDANYHGVATFNYTVSDGNGGYATAVATINLAEVNDAPVTVGETSSTNEDIAILFTQAQLLANDSDVDTATDGQALTITAVSGATNGTVSMLANGDIRFIPSANYHGTASFTYTVSDSNGATTDASVNLTVLAVNDSPTALGDVFVTQEDSAIVLTSAQLLANDTDNDISTDGDVLTISRVFDALHCTVTLNTDGTINLVPDAQYHGNVRFSYEITDASGSTSAAFAVAGVSAVNDAPVSQSDSFDGTEDTLIILEPVDVLANDSDNDVLTDGDSLSLQSVGNASHGTVRLLSSGQIEFLPDANYHGLATFDYVMTDTFGATSTNTVTLSIGAVNDTPVVQGEGTNTNEDTTLYIAASTLLTNDSDVDTATDGQVLSLSAVNSISGKTHGTVTLVTNADGTQTVQFVPDANYHGVASFNYTVSDGNGGYATALATVNLAAVNDAPVTVGETSSTNEDVGLTFTQAQLLANDSDVDTATDGQVLTITAVSGATNGTVSMLANGDIQFIPNANYHGAASFTYTVSDGNGATTDASVSITVNAVNDTPVVQGESTSTNEDTTLYIAASTLLANDSDVDTITDGQVLSLSAVNSISRQTHGTVSLVNNTDGTQAVQFTPDANYHGVASFNYTVSDGNGGYATAVATINLAAVNDAPVTVGETASTDEDAAIVFTQAELLANDSDVDTATDGQVLTVTAVSGATNGTVSMLANGDIRFIPNANYHGAASFIYTVSDGNGATTDASVSITVNAVNDTPVVQGESTDTNEDTTLYIQASKLLANDSDVDTITDGQVLSLSAVNSISGQTHGTVSLVTNADGTQTVQFTPDANYHGVASFNYTVSDGNGGYATAVATINLAAVNDAPVTVGETSSTDEDIGLTFTQAQILNNDSDVDTATDGQALTITAVSGATNGTVSMLANGDIRFIPNANYHGAASFTYTVSDGNGGTSDASVSITVNAVNDTPVVLGESTSTDEDTRLYIAASTLLANDSDVDTATDGQVLSLSAVSSISGKTHGTVSLVNNADGTQTVQFTPDANYHGVASFNYAVSDGNGGYATAVATINLTAVNDAPVTVGETSSTDEDTGLTFTQAQLLANDSDVDTATDGQVLTITAVSGATNGTVSMLASGDIRFIPNANYHGAASFTYTVSDGNGGTSDASMSITVNAVNDTPVVLGESTSRDEDTTLYIAASKLLANDSDVDTITDGQVLSLSAVNSISGQTHGTVSLVNNADGTQTVQYTPDANYHGVASFNYTVSDGNGGYATAVATINLAAVNDAPVTVGEISSTDEDTAIFFTQTQLLANDSDVDTATDGQALTITAVSGATNGTVSMLANGDIRFIPNANYHGAASFTYTVSDGNGGTTDASVSITVNAINDVPAVTGETVSTNEDTRLWFVPSDLLANDTDVDVATDGQVLTITAVSNATHGTVAFVTQADGSQRIAFTPDANYFGVASFQYTVSDGAGGTSTGTVSINVAQINDLPVASDDSLSGSTEDNALHISFAKLLSNDTDADSTNALLGGTNDVLTISAVGNATHGSVALVNGEVVFTPDANYHGVASFVYQVRDQSGALSQATAAFTITAVNDAPVATGETISSSEDSNLLLNQSDLLKNDSDVDAETDGQVLTIKAVSNARHGSVTLNADGTILFVPDANYYGTASFDYTVDDGNGGTASATATITLLSVNDAPVATGETVQGVEDQQLMILSSALLQNDTDVDNSQASLVISRVQSGAGGTAYLNANGHVVFTPTTNYNGNATFTYWVKDPDGLESNAVTATVAVTAVNDAPSAQGEIVTGASEDAVFNINKSILLANDSDIDDANNALSLSWVGNASGGSVSLDDNGNVVFTPNANYNGTASFQYKVRDAAGAESAVVQAVIPVTSVNDAPVAVDDQFDTYKNTPMTVAFSQLTSNDSDVDGDSLTVSAVRDHANGHASIVDGQVQFQATTGFTGAASFDYLSDDGHGGQTWATAYVNVKEPPNKYPISIFFNGNGYGYYPYSQWIKINFYIEDDTTQSAAATRIQLVSATFHTPENYDESGSFIGGGWVDARTSYTLTRDGVGGHFIFSGYFDLLKTDWLLTDENGLTNHWRYETTSNYMSGGAWYFTYTSVNEHYGYYSPPVILDLNGDSVHFTSLQNSNVTMDVNFDGIQDKMAWACNDDGVLVWDKDQNHQITDASEFGFQTLKADAQTDLEGLQALDTNGNGLLDAGDDKFAEFAVWQDANGNGKTDANEFKTLGELNIASINLKSDGQMRDAGTLLASSGSGESDAVVMGNAAFTRTDGSTGLVADAMLAYEPGHATAAADAQVAEVVRQALLFNQMCNTASASDAPALAFVPIETDVTVQDLLAIASEGLHQTLQAA